MLVLCTVTVAGCSRVSGWLSSPFKPREPVTLEPKGGYPTAADESRQLMSAITGARLEAISEGQLLVVTGQAPVKGWWDVALITETPQPTGRFRPDEDGVLRLRLVGSPPTAEGARTILPADPRVDSITAAIALSHVSLAGVERIQITAAQNTVTIRR